MAISNAEACRRYRARHPERVKERDRAHRKKYPEKRRKLNRDFAERNPEKVKVYRKTADKNRQGTPRRKAVQKVADRKQKMRRAGFTLELFELLWAFQGGRCAICTLELTRDTHKPASGQADHCHTSGEPRGVLCHFCNTSLGGYEKHQRLAGLVLAPYDAYLAFPPAKRLP